MTKTQVFTICSNNYLAQATVLGKSLLRHNPLLKFSIVLIDRRSEKIRYDDFSSFELIHIEEIFPEAEQLAFKYNIIEFNTAVKPLVFQHFLNERENDVVLYFDPDICVYSRLDPIINELNPHQVVLTPHILTPIVEDGFYPDDNAVLKFGIYNLGFLGVRKGEESSKMLNWWKEHTFLKGYINIEKGQFTDQLPMSLVPVFFNDVKIMKHKGMNMAPWNLHERSLKQGIDGYQLSGGEDLIFYHFSEFKPGDPLKLSNNGWYNRFTLGQRKDLQKLYEEYSRALVENNYHILRSIPCYFYKDKKVKKSPRKYAIGILERMTRKLKK